MKGPDLYVKAKTLIPGGTQLLSKRPELFLPEKWPAYYSRAKGVEVADLDGRSFTDMSIMGVALAFSDMPILMLRLLLLKRLRLVISAH